MKKAPPVELTDRDIVRIAKGAGKRLPEGFVDAVLDEARMLDEKKAGKPQIKKAGE